VCTTNSLFCENRLAPIVGPGKTDSQALTKANPMTGSPERMAGHQLNHTNMEPTVGELLQLILELRNENK